MSKGKKHPKLSELPAGEVYFLDEPKPLKDVENITLAGRDVLEAKYQDALRAFDERMSREILELLDEKDDE